MNARIRPDWDIRDAILEMGGTDAYKCYQCGKCMAVCPWTHVESVTFPVYRTPQSVKFGAIMSSEDTAEIEREVTEVYRCVGCESCSTWCPHGVRMPDIMRGIRRILVEFGSYPSELSESVSRIHSSGNPFGEPREQRAAWTEGIEVPPFETGMDYLYSPCCVPAYDPRAVKVAKASVEVLKAANVSFGILGDGESCCSEAIRRAGAEEVFQAVAGANVAAFSEAGVKKVVTTSPHCHRTFDQEYGELEAEFESVHQTQLFARLIEQQRLEPKKALDKKVVYHDPCALGRGCGVPTTRASTACAAVAAAAVSGWRDPRASVFPTSACSRQQRPGPRSWRWPVPTACRCLRIRSRRWTSNSRSRTSANCWPRLYSLS
jgi:Fe-S oxidoreductase